MQSKSLFHKSGILLLAIGNLLFQACAASQARNKSTPLAPAVSPALRVEPARIVAGQTADLVWDVPGSQAVSISGIGTHLPPSGRRSIKPTGNHCYQLAAYKGGLVVAQAQAGVIVGRQMGNEDSSCFPEMEKYTAGRRSFDATAENQYRIEIFGSDLSGYPQAGVLLCSVRDDRGHYITGLTRGEHRSAWKIIVEKWQNTTREVKIIDVKEMTESERQPIAVSFVTDYSGSMVGDIGAQEQALNLGLAKLRLDELDKNGAVKKKGVDSYNIIQFDHGVYKSAEGATATGATGNMLSFANLGGATAFYDGSIAGLDLLDKAAARRIAILLTDGSDNSSLANATSVVQKARAANISVFVIGFGGSDQDMLSRIAASTGGRAYFPGDSAELSAIFSEIFLLLDSYYKVSYRPLPAQKGQMKEVGIRLTLHGQTVEGSTALVPIPGEIDPGPRTLLAALFPTNRAKPEVGFYPHLRAMAKYLASTRTRVIIRGHTDTFDHAGSNYQLSLRRARFIQAFLLHSGVAPWQIVSVDGYGEATPLHRDDTKAPWAARENRRVEVILYGK